MSAEPGARLAAVIQGFHREGYVSHGIGDDEGVTDVEAGKREG